MIRININIIQTNKVLMNIIPFVEQRLFPFDFYKEMRNKHPITYDETNDAYAAFRYQDVRKILFNDRNLINF
jgi:hypothetical protein